MTTSYDTIETLIARAPSTASRLNLSWLAAANHEDRFSILEKALDHCFRELVDGKHLNREGKVSEDQLSVQICQILGGMGIMASHDTQVGGHVDILVRDIDGFQWIGEAKIDRGPAYVEGGFCQLSTRYGTSGEGRNRGEVIVYTWFPKAAERLQEWQNHLIKISQVDALEVVQPIQDPKWFFKTQHTCPASGNAFHVRHVFVPLHFEPTK